MQATGQLDTSAPTTNSVVAGAMRSARAAQVSWAATSPAERARILRRFHDTLYRRRHEVAELITAESGKAYTDAFGVDVLG